MKMKTRVLAIILLLPLFHTSLALRPATPPPCEECTDFVYWWKWIFVDPSIYLIGDDWDGKVPRA